MAIAQWPGCVCLAKSRLSRRWLRLGADRSGSSRRGMDCFLAAVFPCTSSREISSERRELGHLATTRTIGFLCQRALDSAQTLRGHPAIRGA